LVLLLHLRLDGLDLFLNADAYFVEESVLVHLLLFEEADLVLLALVEVRLILLQRRCHVIRE
jgi:hypothetical protein